MKNKQKGFSLLSIVGSALILIPSLIVVAVLNWLTSKISIGSVSLVLLGLMIVGIILMLTDFVKASTKGIPSMKPKYKFVITEMLVIIAIPGLIYWGINPLINKSLISRPEFVTDLLIVSTVLLGFTMATGGLRYRVPQGELKDKLDSKLLIFADFCLLLSLIIGFITIVWILRWLVVNDDQLLNRLIGCFSAQVSFTFISSLVYLYSTLFYPKKDKISTKT